MNLRFFLFFVSMAQLSLRDMEHNSHAFVHWTVFNTFWRSNCTMIAFSVDSRCFFAVCSHTVWASARVCVCQTNSINSDTRRNCLIRENIERTPTMTKSSLVRLPLARIVPQTWNQHIELVDHRLKDVITSTCVCLFEQHFSQLYPLLEQRTIWVAWAVICAYEMIGKILRSRMQLRKHQSTINFVVVFYLVYHCVWLNKNNAIWTLGEVDIRFDAENHAVRTKHKASNSFFVWLENWLKNIISLAWKLNEQLENEFVGKSKCIYSFAFCIVDLRLKRNEWIRKLKRNTKKKALKSERISCGSQQYTHKDARAHARRELIRSENVKRIKLASKFTKINDCFECKWQQKQCHLSQPNDFCYCFHFCMSPITNIRNICCSLKCQHWNRSAFLSSVVFARFCFVERCACLCEICLMRLNLSRGDARRCSDDIEMENRMSNKRTAELACRLKSIVSIIGWP